MDNTMPEHQGQVVQLSDKPKIWFFRLIGLYVL